MTNDLRNRARRLLAALLCLAAASACSGKSEAPPAPAAEPSARFYYDLGPATVDVSAYPARQQEGYRLFLAVCGTCHSTARSLNAPYVEADAWKRYARRMHLKMAARAILPSAQDESRILEFLVYDSTVRKLDNPAEFSELQEKLKAEFAEASRR